MANRFEFLVPDIAGAYQRGRAEVRQADRERLADQEMRAQLERGNQFRQLAGQAYGAASPNDRSAILAQAAAADPQGAMALEQQLGSQEDRKQALRANTARMLMAVPQSARSNVYRQIVPQFRQAGLDAPDEYTPEMDAMMQAYAAQQSGQTPAQVQAFRAMTEGLTPDQIKEAREIELGLRGRATSAGMSMQKITGPDGREYAVVFDPRTGQPRPVSMEELFGGGAPPLPTQPQPTSGPAPIQPPPPRTPFAGLTPAEKAAQEAQAKADVELRTAPEIAQRTAEATGLGKNQAELQETQRKNQTAFSVYSAARSNLERAMAGTDTGPLAGRLPAMTSAQQIAEGAGAAMAPVLKNLFRDAGEGTFTEGDQKLLTDMLPKRTDHPEVVTAKLGMIDQIIAAKLGAQSPSTPAAPAASRSQQQAPSFATEAEAEAAGLAPGTRVIIGGVSGTWQ